MWLCNSLASLLILQLINHVYADTPSCIAGVVFLRSTAAPNPEAQAISSTDYPENNTYVIHVSYPCDRDPMHRIEGLQKKVNDPFVSYFIKKKKSSHRSIRSEYGSGDYDEDDDEDDEDDEEDDDDSVNEIDVDDHTSIEPSLHIVIPQPTPSGIHAHFSEPPASIEYLPVSPAYIPEISSFSINPTRTFPSASSVEDFFPNLGSGDGPTPILSTPTFNPTDYVSPSYYPSPSSNTPTPPLGYVRQNIPKQLVHEGVLHKLEIPRNTFEPPCSDYKLHTSESWVDLKQSTVRFFPVQNHTSEWSFVLECRDHGATTNLTVMVRQRQKSRNYNHAFNLEFGMIRDKYSRVEVLEKLVHDITHQLGSHGNNTCIVIRHALDTYPYRISYVNESLISTTCPVEEMKRVYEALTNIHGFIKMDRVTLTIPTNNQCNPSVIHEITGESTTDSRGHVAAENFPPSIKNQIDKINGTVGEYLVFDVKSDFCYDPEDGETRNLHLSLGTSELAPVAEDHWLQFDIKNQEFYGLPMSVFEQDFVLTCADSKGKSANDVLVVSITEPRIPATSYNAEFSMHFESISFTPKAIRKFIEKLSSILSPDILVHEYSESNGHVLLKWFNTTNPSSEHEITVIRKVLLSDDGPVNKRFHNHFAPEFNVTVASVIPRRKLLSENHPFNEVVGATDNRYFDFDEHDVTSVQDTRENDKSSKSVDGIASVDNYSGYLTTYIIPSVLIAIMILLALIIACLLSRKNKYTQASTEDDSPNARVYLKNAKKGVPIILENEYDEKLFGNDHNRGNIYEPQLPRSGTGTPRTTHPGATATADNCSSGMNSPRVTSPNPLPRNFTPQPPDYTSSINRNMMRNRPPMMMHHQSHHPVVTSPPQYELRERQMDSYAPPAPISYYGIHNSNSGGNYSSYAGPAGHNKNGLPPPYVPP